MKTLLSRNRRRTISRVFAVPRKLLERLARSISVSSETRQVTFPPRWARWRFLRDEPGDVTSRNDFGESRHAAGEFHRNICFCTFWTYGGRCGNFFPNVFPRTEKSWNACALRKSLQLYKLKFSLTRENSQILRKLTNILQKSLGNAALLLRPAWGNCCLSDFLCNNFDQ